MPEKLDELDNFSKPGFDGRQQYYKLVGNYMIAIAMYQSIHDYNSWLDNIHGLFDMVIPFIRNEDAKKIEKKIQECRKLIDNLNQSCMNKTNQALLNRHIELQLHDLTQTLYKCSKHMLLPFSEDHGTDLSEEAFFSGSDL